MPAGHLPVTSYLAVPVRSRTGEVLGGLFFGHERPGVFGEREERLAVGVAGWAAVAMDNARLYAAEHRARSDAEAAAAQLTDQALELELSNQQLQEQAAELEMQSEELQATAAHLEERTEAAEEAAAALRRSEQRYELAARATRNAIWDWDLATDALAWNPGVADVFGYRPEDVADTIQWWYDHIHPDDRDRVVTGIHAVIDDPLGGADWEDEYRFQRGDGTYAHVYDRGTVARAGDGRAVRMIGAMLDVTREREALAAAEAGRRAAEATTRRAAFAGAVGIAITGGGTLDDMLQRCCQAAVDHLDAAFARAWVLDSGDPVLVLRASAGLYTHLDGAHGRVPVGQFKIGQIAAEQRPHLTNAVIGDPRVPEQAWARREGMVAFAGYPLVVGEELVGVFALFARQPLDEATFEALATAATGLSVAVTNARLLEAERRAREAAEAANQSKSEFLANMSHELRTPLNAIGGYAELLELGLHGPITDDQRHALGRVRKAQRRLLALINDILNFAKLERGQVEYDVQAVEVADVVRDVLPFVEPQVAAKGLALELRLPEGACSVSADREKLGQVLVNLLSNATKFTDARHPVTGEPGRVRVEVTTRTEGSALFGPYGGRPEAVFVRVTDTGRGIPQGKLDVIFDPFVQVHAGRTRTTEGTGLGLAISRDLARGMGADLTVESTLGVGSTFTLTLPRT
jgi:PAS domain S-box-containing protein